MHAIVLSVSKAVDNLRSAVSKNGMLCVSDMFYGLKTKMNSEIEYIILSLLKKTIDNSGFLNEAADNAIQSIFDNCTDVKIVPVLMQMTQHRNCMVKGKAIYYLCNYCKTLGVKVKKMKDFEAIVKLMLKSTSEPQPETRTSSRNAIVEMYNNEIITDAMLKRALNNAEYLRIKKEISKGY